MTKMSKFSLYTQSKHQAKTRSSPKRSFTRDQLAMITKVLSSINHYETLNLSIEAKREQIKSSYLRLAKQLHPDKNKAPGSKEAFQRLGQAFEVLNDDRRRQSYNVELKMGFPQNQGRTFSQAFRDSTPNTEKCCNQRKYPCGYETNENWAKSFSNQNDDNDDDDNYEFWHGFEQKNSHLENERKRRQFRRAFEIRCRILLYCAIIIFGLILFITLYNLRSRGRWQRRDYSLKLNSERKILRHTQHGNVPYYVDGEFEKTHHGDMLGQIEKEVIVDYMVLLKDRCYNERNQHEMDELIEKLKSTSVSSSSSSDDTTSLLSEISATKDPKLFDKHELAELFLQLTKSENVNIRKEAAKCIAEITKSEVQRKKFTKRDIIEAFLECLRNISQAATLELPIQICRALGNICYLNDEARDIILDLKGDEVLLHLLDITEISDAANAPQFIKVRSGLLSNYLLGGEGLAKRAMELNIMEKLQAIITLGCTNVEEHEELLLNTLPLLSILTENVADLNFDPNLNIQLSRILAASTNPDLAEMCLELLHYQAENDDVKLLLAKDGLCETIYNLLEKYKMLASTSEARALMKLACELIVLVLTGDESMHYLYSTPLLKNMEDWLNSDDIDLLTTGVLALGNFARTDSHCIYMVENKVMNKLLDVLAKNNGVKDDVRLQHALLSALRNLVIPKPNKSAVIQAGLVETILPMLEIHQPPVVFKLLGTLRMTVDGQEKLALELLKNKNLIEQLVHWSKSSDYAGVTGESLRLMAWLVKHAYLNKIAYALPRKGDAPLEEFAEKIPPQDYDRTSLREFISNEGTIEAMINMLTSQHLVMQNEALIALCIISVVYLTNNNGTMNDEVESVNLQETFIKYEVGKKLSELIKRSSDTMTKEIVENLQNFTNLLKASEKLLGHLEENNIGELLKSIPILTEYCTL